MNHESTTSLPIESYHQIQPELNVVGFIERNKAVAIRV